MNAQLKQTLTDLVTRIKSFSNGMYVTLSSKGVANGIATLDGSGKVPTSQLPSFVDDVVEVANFDALPPTGETGKIYVTLDDNKTYRWSGTTYVEISSSLALGETSSTAYRGDRGKTAYDHSQITFGNPHGVTKSEIGLGNVENKSVAEIKSELRGTITSGNAGFATGGDVYAGLNNKVDKEAGKGLSSNDFTDEEKSKLSSAIVGQDLVASQQDIEDMFA